MKQQNFGETVKLNQNESLLTEEKHKKALELISKKLKNDIIEKANSVCEKIRKEILNKSKAPTKKRTKHISGVVAISNSFGHNFSDEEIQFIHSNLITKKGSSTNEKKLKIEDITVIFCEINTNNFENFMSGYLKKLKCLPSFTSIPHFLINDEKSRGRRIIRGGYYFNLFRETISKNLTKDGIKFYLTYLTLREDEYTCSDQLIKCFYKMIIW